MYDSIMSEEVDMNEQNEDEADVNEEHVDCSYAFNTSQVFVTRDDVLHWTRSVAYEIGFVTVMRGRTSFVLIGCERSGQYKYMKKDLVRRDTSSRKCGCPFKHHGKPVVGGQGWMGKLMCGSHNHKMTKSLIRHSYVGRLTKNENIIIADMTKSMMKPRNIFLTLKKHNVNSYTTIKQIYNVRSAYRYSIRGNNIEMQQLIKLLEQDQLKDEDVVRDIFWCHPDAVKLCNVYSTYKTNKYRLPLLDFVGVTPTGMTFSAGFAYLEGKLSRFFLRRDALHRVIVTDRNLALMNAVKNVFPECTNLLCRFHIDKNVKAKCKSLVGKKKCMRLCDGCLGEFG
ncbi:PKS-NRPS hybrid synthetase [Glycine max]|nr:PKS-NRPS hybrid synthetase [Glycine max]